MDEEHPLVQIAEDIAPDLGDENVTDLKIEGFGACLTIDQDGSISPC